jgi:NAD(P) transhydrogenase
MSSSAFDAIVLGAGPAGHKAAIQAAKVGKRVLLIDRQSAPGGECVHRGTIPSKTLRETAAYLLGLRARSEGEIDVAVPAHTKVSSLMRRLRTVRTSHEHYLAAQLERNQVELWHGRARFRSSSEVEVRLPNGLARQATAPLVVIATGSRPRQPTNVPVDHESVLDSDSILSLIYLPTSLVVLGSGVIACEFASLFAALGVNVTLVDAAARPLSFLEAELTDPFVDAFRRLGGKLELEQKIESVRCEGSEVVTKLESGRELRAEKCLCALGRVADVKDLDLAAAGVELTSRGHIAVDENLRTSVAGIYAAGDVVGPPALASVAIEQGRRAMRHGLGLSVNRAGVFVPTGIYTLPEIASVGLTEERARAQYGSALVGRARYRELARAHINGQTEGLLKLVAAPDGRLLGAHVVGEGAIELVHVAQIALVGNLTLEAFVDNVFNFPTLAEAYRVAAIDAVAQTPTAASSALSRAASVTATSAGAKTAAALLGSVAEEPRAV